MNSIRFWNNVTNKLVADDYSYNSATPPIKKPDQPGPTATSRALAIIHLAMYNVIRIANGNAPILGIGAPSANVPSVPATLKVDAAIGAAAAAVATALYSKHAASIAKEALDFAKMWQTDPKSVEFGLAVATLVLGARANDGAATHVAMPGDDIPYGQGPGEHRSDPHNPGQKPLHRLWGDVRHFSLPQGTHGAIMPPPELNSTDYATHYREVLDDGRDDIVYRDPAKAAVGIFWAYDGPNKLGTPPRLYNQIAGVIANQNLKGLNGDAQRDDDARLFAMVHVGMCDAGISAWHWKYVYNVWRPVVGIREAGELNALAVEGQTLPESAGAAGSTGLGDTNPDTNGHPFWSPLGAQRTNEKGFETKNVTPNFPAYPSGHSTFGSAAFGLIAAHYGKALSEIKFDFVSDEFNGESADVSGSVRPKLTRHLSLESAEYENGISRVWLGVHWRFDANGGRELGRDIVGKVTTLFA